MTASISPYSLLARGLQGQDSAAIQLKQAVLQQRIGHAYLFVGPAGAGKLEAAYAFAQAVLCPEEGVCGQCSPCRLCARRTHPDVHYFSPESVQGYLIEQIHAMTEDLVYAPVLAQRKVYIIDDAGALGGICANALLKSLEEPPERVCFILLAQSRTQLLPTIVSRCQSVVFRPVDAVDTLVALAEEHGLPLDLLRRCRAACASPARAVEFARSEELLAARSRALDALEMLPQADELNILHLAAATVDGAKAALDDLKEEQAAVLAGHESWMDSRGLKQVEVGQQRERAACELQILQELLAAMRALVQDALMQASGSSFTPSCDDYIHTSTGYAETLGVPGCVRAQLALDRAAARIRSHVTPQLVFETLLFDIKEIFPCPK